MEDLKKTLKDITSKQDELVDDNTIDRFVETIEVHKDHFVWKFNFIDNIISLVVAKKKSSNGDLSVKKDKMTAEVGDCTSCNQSWEAKLISNIPFNNEYCNSYRNLSCKTNI